MKSLPPVSVRLIRGAELDTVIFPPTSKLPPTVTVPFEAIDIFSDMPLFVSVQNSSLLLPLASSACETIALSAPTPVVKVVNSNEV